jgi:hypothetical protein
MKHFGGIRSGQEKNLSCFCLGGAEKRSAFRHLRGAADRADDAQ